MTLKQWIRLQNIQKSASDLKNCVIQFQKGLFYRPYFTLVYFKVDVEHLKKLFASELILLTFSVNRDRIGLGLTSQKLLFLLRPLG